MQECAGLSKECVGMCWIFNECVCLNHSWRYEHNQFKRCDEKLRPQRQFFQNFQRLKSVLLKKIVQYLHRFMYLFCPKISKNDSRKLFVEKVLDSILYAPNVGKMN